MFTAFVAILLVALIAIGLLFFIGIFCYIRDNSSKNNCHCSTPEPSHTDNLCRTCRCFFDASAEQKWLAEIKGYQNDTDIRTC